MLRAIQPMEPEEVLSARCEASTARAWATASACPPIARSRRSPPDSATETYVALKLQVDNWRWAGVPFYLRTGKRMPQGDTEIVIQFKGPPQVLFRGTASRACRRTFSACSSSPRRASP